MSDNNLSPIDTDVKIPAAVRAAAARSEEIIKAMNAGQNPEVTAEGNAEPAANPELSAEILAQPLAEDKQTTPTPQPQEKSGDEESWEHRYKSMKGRYDRSQEQIRTLSEEIRNLQNVIATMQSAPSVQIPELSAERLITEEEEKDYGQDFLKVVGKKAREELTPVIKSYEAKIAELEARLQGVSGVMAQDTQAKMLATLDEKLPQWREINRREDFLDWLQLPDPYSGDIRHNMLKAAYAQSSASRVLAFFQGFLAEEAAVAPAKAEPDSTVETVSKVPLANLAAPGRAKSAAGSGAPAEKPIFTRAQIAKFYADIAANKYRGRDADKNKMEAQIFEAQREGRIV